MTKPPPLDIHGTLPIAEQFEIKEEGKDWQTDRLPHMPTHAFIEKLMDELADARSGEAGARKRIEELNDEIARFRKMADDAWRQRDDLIQELQMTDQVVIQSLSLISYLAAKLKRDSE